MQTVRTTITLPKETHDELKTLAFLSGESLNSVILSKLSNDKNEEVKKRKKALADIRKIAKKLDFSGLDYKELINNGRKH